MLEFIEIYKGEQEGDHWDLMVKRPIAKLCSYLYALVQYNGISVELPNSQLRTTVVYNLESLTLLKNELEDKKDEISLHQNYEIEYFAMESYQTYQMDNNHTVNFTFVRNLLRFLVNECIRENLCMKIKLT